MTNSWLLGQSDSTRKQRRAAVQTMSDPGEGDGGVLEGSTRESCEGYSWDEVIIGARCSVQRAK